MLACVTLVIGNRLVSIKIVCKYSHSLMEGGVMNICHAVTLRTQYVYVIGSTKLFSLHG